VELPAPIRASTKAFCPSISMACVRDESLLGIAQTHRLAIMKIRARAARSQQAGQASQAALICARHDVFSLYGTKKD